MPYCSRCGVEVQDKKECPLCFAPIQILDNRVSDALPAYPKTEKLRRFTKKERLFFIWLPLAASLFAAIIIVLVINLSQGAMSWSKYPVVSLGASILILTGSFLLAKRPLLLNLWIGFTVAGLLYLLDLFGGPPTWFYVLGLPLLLYFLSLSLVFTVGAPFFKKNISILFFVLSTALSLFFPCLELLINHLRKSGSLSWSLIVTTVFATLSFILLVYILFVKKRVDIQKYFHA